MWTNLFVIYQGDSNVCQPLLGLKSQYRPLGQIYGKIDSVAHCCFFAIFFAFVNFCHDILNNPKIYLKFIKEFSCIEQVGQTKKRMATLVNILIAKQT